MKRDHLLWWPIIGIVLLIIYLGIQRWQSIQYQSERDKFKEKTRTVKIYDKREMAIDSLQSSRLFGIKLGGDVIELISGLNNFEPTDEEYKNWFDPSGLIKGTKKDYFNTFQYSVLLNDFISRNGKALDWLFLYQNDDFSKYYVEYNPYSKEISAVIASLKKEYTDHETCVKNLRPYVNLIVERIKKDNPDENLIIDDRFFPKLNGKENFPILWFKYKNKKNLSDTFVLHLKAFCGLNNESIIMLEAPMLQIDHKTYKRVLDDVSKNLRIISEKKDLKLKEKFIEDANKEKSKINKSGL